MLLKKILQGTIKKGTIGLLIFLFLIGYSQKNNGEAEITKEVLPFNKNVNHPDSLKQKGLNYVLNILESAQKTIQLHQIASQAFPESFVGEIIPPELIVKILIIEHIDPKRFKKEETEKLVAEVLIKIGMLDSLVYCHSESSAGALGLFQFIASTYESVRWLYPQAPLIPDFEKGMADHKNAAIAALLLLDADLAMLPYDRRQFLKNNPGTMALYLSAAYNCGAPRAENNIQKYKKQWQEHLPAETKNYLEKYAAVQELFNNKKIVLYQIILLSQNNLVKQTFDTQQ